jgi:phage repressor protein C with HTH and peptisase S24 domain
MSIQSDAHQPEETDVGLLERFSEILDALGPLALASELTGNSAQQISKWRKGKAKLPFRQAAILARAAGRSVDWLAFGEEHATGVSTQPTQAPSHGDEPVVWIPLLDVIASAGPGASNPYPFEIDRLPFPRRWLEQLGVPEEFVQFVPIHGDSMEPTVRDGAVSLVDTRFQTPRIEAIYVVVDEDDVRLKRIGRGLAGSLTLISDNERYATDVLSPIDAGKLKIAGRAFWAGGKI